MEVAAPADFRRDTAVQAIGGGRFTAEIKEAWSGPPGPNGGYVAAIILRAIRAMVDDPARQPRSLTVHYLRPPADGAVEISVEIERSGRSATTCSAGMMQGGKTTCLALCVLSGDFESAANWFRQFLETNPDPGTAQSVREVLSDWEREGRIIKTP